MEFTLKTLPSSIQHFFDNNGERPPLQKKFEEISSDLQYAYQRVAKIAQNHTIFDYGCGGGYGTEYLSRFTNKKVFGYDIDNLSISSANKFFSQNPNTQFDIKIPIQKFDVLVSFQVIEHLTPSKLSEYFKNIRSLTKHNSKIYISTPNKYITSYKLAKPIFTHHIKEYSPVDLKKLLKKHFSTVKIYGQTDTKTINKVDNKLFSYKNLANISLKHKVFRFISQIDIFRFFIAATPQHLKNLLLGQVSVSTTKQILVSKKRYVDNSYILIAKCTP